MSVTREEYQPPEYDEPEENAGADETPDPFADLDDDTRATVEAEVSRRAGVSRAQIRANLQAQGLDVTDDDQPVLRDPSRVSGWLGRPEPQVQQPQQQVAAPPPEEDDQIPDPVMDPVGFKKWHLKEVAQATKGLTEAIQYERSMRVASDIEIAVAAVPAAVEQFAPRFKDVLRHPGFDKAIREALSQVDPAQTKDRANLARVVAMLSVDLDPAAIPAERPRDPAGRFSDARDAGRSTVSRQTLAQSAPSRDAGRQTKGREVTDVHRAVAERLSSLGGKAVSPEEIALLEEDATGETTRDMRKKRLAEIKGRGR